MTTFKELLWWLFPILWMSSQNAHNLAKFPIDIYHPGWRVAYFSVGSSLNDPQIKEMPWGISVCPSFSTTLHDHFQNNGTGCHPISALWPFSEEADEDSGDSVCFLGLSKGMTTTLVTENNRNISSPSSGGQKSAKKALSGLVPSGGPGGEFVPCLSPSLWWLPTCVGISLLADTALQSLSLTPHVFFCRSLLCGRSSFYEDTRPPLNLPWFCPN